jgi:conjugative relaxase-like TrwC/TraI family protein
VLTVAKIERSRASYYLSSTAAGADHAGGLIEADGVWLGKQAAALGLSGVASATAVRALFAGRSPLDGAQLLSEPNRRRLSAYDCTFSTPKSVSILFALGPPQATEKIRLAHEKAVRASLEYLERHGAGVRQERVDGRNRVVRTDDGVLAVAWLHRSSRAPDPHLHTHVLIANLARRRSGEWRSLDARDIYVELRTAAALYETHLRGDLTARLGLAWSELNGFWADVQGSDPGVIRAMSQRSAEIALAMAESGLRGPAAARLVGGVTRPPKDFTVSYPELVKSWWRRAHGEGLAAAHLAAMVGRATGPSAESRHWEEATLAAASARSLDGTFTRRELIQARCAAAPSGRDAAAVERDVEHLLAGPRLLVRSGGGARAVAGWRSRQPPGEPEPRYTTAEIVATERRLAAAAAERPFEVTVVAYRPGARAQALDELSRAHGTWSAAERYAAALAPGWRAAASVEAATGIECVSTPAFPRSWPEGRLPAGPSGANGCLSLTEGLENFSGVPTGGVLVMADAQCFSTAVLEQALRYTRARSAQLVIVGPAGDFAERGAIAGIAEEARGRLPVTQERLQNAGRPNEVAMRRRFGDVGAVVTTSLSAAMSEAARELREAPPATVLVVAGDHGIVSSLREEVAGSRAPFVLHANDLAGAHASAKPGLPGGAVGPRRLVVIGGAAVLRAAPDRRLFPDRRHLIVMPAVLNGTSSLGPPALEAVVGRAAEACRPRYLIAELGSPRREAAARAEWRSAAATIEAFRERWGVTDQRNAFGLARQVGDRLQEWDLERRQAREELGNRGLAAFIARPRSRGLESGR